MAMSLFRYLSPVIMAAAVYYCSCGGGDATLLGGDRVCTDAYPDMIYSGEPAYPRLARQAGIEGTVWIKALVDEDGDVVTALVSQSSGTSCLDQSALEAAYRCRYRPGYHNCGPVKVWVTYPVEFVIREAGGSGAGLAALLAQGCRLTMMGGPQ